MEWKTIKSVKMNNAHYLKTMFKISQNMKLFGYNEERTTQNI